MMTTLDPRVKAANMKAATHHLAEAAARVKCLRKDLKDLDQDPPSARLFALKFKLSSAEHTERCALREARRAGLEDGKEYPTTVDGRPCFVFIDGPSVCLFSD